MKFSEKWTAALLLAAGFYLRLQHLFHIHPAAEPFRLGGLFVAFSRQILQAGFALPHTIPFYSAGGLPFAYPPLAFYLEASLLALWPRGDFLLANLLPPLLACLTLAVFAWGVNRAWPNSPARQLSALFACAFLPNAFSNQIEAAGLAEALGSLALAVYFWAVWQFRLRPNTKNALKTGLALAFCVLSSPGSAIGAAWLTLLLAGEHLLRERLRPQAWMRLSVIALSGAALSAPYWLTVMLRFGRGFFLQPVLAQFAQPSSQSPLQSLLRWSNFVVVADGWTFGWNLVIFLGLAWSLSRRQAALPAALLGLMLIPRENVWLMALPAALLFGLGFENLLLPLLSPRPLPRLLIVLPLAVWAALLSLGLAQALEKDQQWRLTAAQAQRMEQARALLPEDALIVVLGNEALMEWAPYLLQRETINTAFGLEWQPAEAEAVNALNARLEQAHSWREIRAALPPLSRPVYILSSEKKRLTALSRGGDFPFTLKFESAEIQLGLLGNP